MSNLNLSGSQSTVFEWDDDDIAEIMGNAI